ncbi:hypothetical protein K8I61_13095 [bacterium]|nr:hypothetical protein [bacterium]
MDEQDEKITLHRDGQSIRIHIPLKFKRRGGRKEIIVPEGLEKFLPRKQPAKYALLVALARAFRWKELLETGQVASMSELAKIFRVDASYLSRILRLTLLAPDIVEFILEGQEPSGLSLSKITKHIPLLWLDQKTSFGIIKRPQVV